MGKDFVKRLIDRRLINAGMMPVFVLLMPCCGDRFRPDIDTLWRVFGPVLFLLLLAAIFEEPGWRGYGFDSFPSRLSYFQASLVFSILWSLWYFPLVFVNNSYQYEIFHQNICFGVNFFLSIIPMSMIISWICIKNRKSIIAAVLFHFFINISQEILAITRLPNV